MLAPKALPVQAHTKPTLIGAPVGCAAPAEFVD